MAREEYRQCWPAFMDVEVWGFEFEEVMHFFPIDVSDLEPNRQLQTRYCCGMMVDFDHKLSHPF